MATAIFRDAQDITVQLPYRDEAENDITPASVSYRVYDQAGAEVVEATALAYSVGDTYAEITIAAADNTIDTTRATRVVELVMALASGAEITIESRYILQRTARLVAMENSYQTFEQAELLALDIATLDEWPAAADDDRKTALAHAFNNIGQLTYADWMEGADPQAWFFFRGESEDGRKIITNLNSLTTGEFATLSVPFKAAILRAQLVEADILLGGDIIGRQRAEGLVSNTIGEASQFYRHNKPLILPVSVQAARVLRKFIQFRTRLGR